jgi:glycosyltransferase involved in cell wall biosynthesis
VVYLRNTLSVIRSRLSSAVEASVFLSPEENAKFGAELSPLVDGRVLVDAAFGQSGRGGSLARAMLTGRDAGLEVRLTAAGMDALFEVGQFYGARFRLPVMSWLPDFQHRYMPQMFSRFNWWRRDLGLAAQVRSRKVLIVSSLTALRDMQRFYPRARGRGHVVRFAIDLDVGVYMGRGAEMRRTYELPARFFYLPNQFWRHKNHAVLIAALARLRERSELQTIPPVVLSGLSRDLRNPGHFEALMQTAQAAGVASHFRYLGLIPYHHVLCLVGSCDALLNPSLFEGWSTPIEEAKALGAPLLLSDIPIHREQAPTARFFDPHSSDEAADALLAIARLPPPPRATVDSLRAAQNQRLDEHAGALRQAIEATISGSAA